MQPSSASISSIFEKIWLGILPLSTLYWGFAILGGVVWKILFSFVDEDNSFTVNLFLLTALVYQLFINVGIWRAADNYKKSTLLAWLAKIATTIGTVVLLITFLGFSNLKAIQNDVGSYQPNSNQTEQQSNKNLNLKEGKIGANWTWEKLDTKKGNVWLEKNMRERDKFNIVTVWLKAESIVEAKKWGSDYNYSIFLVKFSCSDATYHTVNVTDVFYSSDRADEPIFVKESFDSAFKKIELNKTGTGFIKAYEKVCLS
jgi:hypothetical protein